LVGANLFGGCTNQQVATPFQEELGDNLEFGIILFKILSFRTNFVQNCDFYYMLISIIDCLNRN